MLLQYEIAKAENVPEIVALVNSAYRGESSKRGWTTEEHLLDGQRTDSEMLGELLNMEDSVLWLARDADGTLLASVHLKKDENSCHLGMLAVSPLHQNRGLGRLLLEHCEKFARDAWGCRELSMSVIDLREELLAYYERRGYKSTGERIPFPHSNPRYGLPKRTDFALLLLSKAL